MGLRIDEQTYPAGGTYGVFFLDEQEIGRADKVPEGWRPFRKVRTQPTAALAAKVMLATTLQKLKAEEKRIRQLQERLNTVTRDSKA